MGPGATYAIITFLAGVMLLLGWRCATIENPRSGAMLKKSLLLFLLPIMLSPAQFLQFPLSMWVLVAGEEGLKAFASSRESRPIDKFWLVTLFGLWELTVDKPLWGLILAQTIESWDRLAVGGLIYSTILPVLMHAVTAAIYAFTFQGRLWAAFLASCVIHIMFNESADYFGLSPIAAIAKTAILAVILATILRGNIKSRRMETLDTA